MSLISYQESRPWARSIKDRVSTRQMPPWHIDPSVGIQHFKNDMSLSQDQIDTIVRWLMAAPSKAIRRICPHPSRCRPTISGRRARRFRRARHDRQVARVHDAGQAPGRLVAAESEFPSPRPLGQDVEIRPSNLKARKIVPTRSPISSQPGQHRSGQHRNHHRRRSARHADDLVNVVPS